MLWKTCQIYPVLAARGFFSRDESSPQKALSFSEWYYWALLLVPKVPKDMIIDKNDRSGGFPLKGKVLQPDLDIACTQR
jgi:hypothetical protein